MKEQPNSNGSRSERERGGGRSFGNFLTLQLISFWPSQLLLHGIGLRQSGRRGKPGGPRYSLCKHAGPKPPRPGPPTPPRVLLAAELTRAVGRREAGSAQALICAT